MNVESFEIDGWDDLQTGITLAENENWLLVKHIANDYLIDGYKLYNKNFIRRRINSSNERNIERVHILRNTIIEKPDDFEFSDTIGLLKWSQDKYGLFEFQDDDEDALFYGIIKSLIGNTLTIDFINKRGEIDKEFDYEFEIDKIVTVTFESDYFHSVRVQFVHKNPSIAIL